MTRRRRISESRFRKLKGNEQRTLLLLGGVLAAVVILFIFKG